MHHGLRRLGFGHHPNEKENVRNATRLRQFFSRFHPVSRHESKDWNPLLGALHSVLDQLEASLLVHENSAVPALSKARGLVLPNQKKMIASTPSKLPRSKRTSHPSRLSPYVVVHLDLSQWRLCCGVACIIMLPCPCGQKRAFDLDWQYPC